MQRCSKERESGKLFQLKQRVEFTLKSKHEFLVVVDASSETYAVLISLGVIDEENTAVNFMFAK